MKGCGITDAIKTSYEALPQTILVPREYVNRRAEVIVLDGMVSSLDNGSDSREDLIESGSEHLDVRLL